MARTMPSASPKASTSKQADDSPMALNAFLQYLMSHGLSMANAMRAASPLIKQGMNSQRKIASLSDAALSHLGIDDKELRKQLLAIGKKGKKQSNNASPTPKKPRKRGRDTDLDQGLPDQANPREPKRMLLDIDEELNDFTLSTKSVIVNRAPVMAAWSFVVAERLSFSRQEALSLAQAYTEANATSKGVSLGIMKNPEKPNSNSSAQPFVDLMQRKVNVISLQTGEWRAMVNGEQADPEKAFSYIQRAFRQQMGSVVGAMRLLAESFPPAELNEKGYGLYIEFRPQGGQWGEKTEMKLDTILNLRRFLTHKTDPRYGKSEPDPDKEATKVKSEEPDIKPVIQPGEDLFEHPAKRVKSEDQNESTRDAFDDMLDDDADAQIDWSLIDV